MPAQSIIFSGPMVKAILEGRKTQTRRVIKPQPQDTWMNGSNWQEYYKPGKHQVLEKNLWIENHETGKEIPCRYGHPGRQIWVRESWAVADIYDNEAPFELAQTKQGMSLWYKAGGYKAYKSSTPGRWRSPLFMPRWASRLTLEITDVRVERLQDISGYDACHEGAPYEQILENGIDGRDYRKGYQQLWESINGKTFPWSSNPFVWVISFRKLENEENHLNVLAPGAAGSHA